MHGFDEPGVRWGAVMHGSDEPGVRYLGQGESLYICDSVKHFFDSPAVTRV